MWRLLLAAGVWTWVGCAAPGDLVFSPDLVDFGPAVPGLERTQTVGLINQGDATLVLSEARSSSPSFSLVWPPAQLTLSPGETREVSLRYFPSNDASEEAATLEVTTEQGVSATMRATGLPTTPDCALPDTVDFGAVARGDSLTREVVFANDTSHPTAAFVGPVESQQGDGIFLAEDQGSLPIAAASERRAHFSFRPTEAREYAATVRLRRHALCVEKPVRLIGTGVAATLSWTAAVADFGSVSVGMTACQSVTFSNLSFDPLTLTQLSVREGTNPSNVFTTSAAMLIVPAAQRDASGLFGIAPGTASLEVCCTPAATGPRAAQLTASTDLTIQPQLSLNLRCIGVQ